MIVYELAIGKRNSYLYDDEAGATTVRALEVDGPLIMRDVEALDGSSLLQVDRSRGCNGKRKKRGEDRGLHYRNECKIFAFVVFVTGQCLLMVIQVSFECWVERHCRLLIYWAIRCDSSEK